MARSHSNPSSAVKVALVHLGCARNLIDSETILGRLGAGGYQLSGSVEEADVAVLNTCSFIGEARKESEEALERLLVQREDGRLKGLVVVGCLPQVFREMVEAKYPKVDAFLGLSDYSQITRVVEDVLKGRKIRDHGSPNGAPQAESWRLLQTPRSYAYLRPSHGCDHDCAFCIIPRIRGGQRSKPIAAVVEEAGRLAAAGVRELVLVAEDSTGYGTDLGRDGPRLPELVEALAAEPGLHWIRVMYAYPNAFPWRLAEVMRESDRVVPYLDIPIQHISSRVLKRMRRGGTRQSVETILGRLRKEVPGIALRTTVLVGHPGEGKEEFAELLAFLDDFEIDRLGAFVFSPEAETDAGEDPDRCGPEEAHERLAQVMELQSRVHTRVQQRHVGRRIEVLVDAHHGGMALARGTFDAPEVDAYVTLADADERFQPGDLVTVRVTGVDGYDLQAELEQEAS